MDLKAESQDSQIRQIEDIIDIQKANGNINARQVAFNLPSCTESITSVNLAKSLESGLSNGNSNLQKNKTKKQRYKRHKSPLPDAISWPSDSDITVLRMKLCLKNTLKEETANTVPGDGLHHRDSSSMVNLATLMLQSQPASKHSLNLEECLLPLSSWEHTVKPTSKEKTDMQKSSFHFLNKKFKTFETLSNHYAQVQKPL
ncbi:unnamed protein product [Parnassius apollo]|uniref:(apollo) hypothetical protein n=1 Tax=Parnassius apollo TaxID=110799 RepID=A0A8S3WWR9_PARAO|nr:unnamed protein product [Parnassius apollo]